MIKKCSSQGARGREQSGIFCPAAVQIFRSKSDMGFRMALPNRPPTRAKRRAVRLSVELLENRLVPSLAAPPTIALNPANDEFGAQIQTVTQFGDSSHVTLGILDTGASPVTIASTDQAGFASPIPIKVPGGASSGGIGGSVTGDVSVPVTVLTDGLHAATITYDNNFNTSVVANFGPTSSRVFGIQAFVGTDGGSPNVPTISGTPIFTGGLMGSFRTKTAAKIDLINGVDPYGVGIMEPDVHFVPNTTKLVPSATEYLATIPLTRIGSDNVPSPGNDVSANFNFASNSVTLNNTVSNHLNTLRGQKFLLDTGSQMTVISTAEANALHIDLSKPYDSIQVQGVGGTVTVNGYIIDSLQIGLTGVGPLTVKNVPVFVLDAVPGVVDGIIGMNLWNNADQLLVNPFTPFGATTLPTLSVTVDPNHVGTGGTGGFGFEMSALITGHRGPYSLNELLGGAARYFQVPDVTLAAPAANGRTADQENGNRPIADGGVLTAPPGPLPLAGPVYVSSSPTSAPSILIAAHRAASANSHLPIIKTPATAAPRESFDTTVVPSLTRADIVAPPLPIDVESMADQPPTISALSAPEAWVSAGIALGSNETPALPETATGSLAEAALLVALGMIVRGYWLQESNDRHVRETIEAAHWLSFGGASAC
jgi:hypothetical protein